jgi:hypothetical protein
VSERVGVIYCGSCGAMNPRTNHFCSACGHQLVDAYHASEGLRVYFTPDPGAPLVEILDTGAAITVVETDELLPADFVKIALDDGRIGYVRLREVEAAVGADTTPTRREPIGCVTPTALLAVIVLLILTGVLMLAIAVRASDDQGGLIAALACLVVVPFLVLVVGFYLYVRKREEELLAGDDDQDESSSIQEQAPEPLSD